MSHTTEITADTVLDDAVDDLPAASRARRLPFSLWHLVLIPLTFVLIAPLVWMLLTSLQTHAEATHFPPVLVPEHPRFQNYADAWAAAPFGHFLLIMTEKRGTP